MPVDIGNAGALERARQWLTEHLRNGPQLRVELIRMAIRDGYNEKNIEAAARQLGLMSERVRSGGQGWRAQWRIPTPAEEKFAAQAAQGDDPSVRTITQQLQEIQGLSRMVDIYRYADGEAQFLDSLPANEITLRGIKRRFGGGRYTVEGIGFLIEGRPINPDGEPFPKRTDAPAGVSSGQLDVNTLVIHMLKSQGDMVTALLSRGGQQSTDPVALFNAIEAAVEKRTSNIPQAPPTPVDQALALLEKGMAMGRASAEGEDGEDRQWTRTLGSVAPFLNALVSKMTGAPPAPTAALPAPSGEVAPAPAPREGIPVTALQRVMVDLGPAVPQLLEQAKKGTPPAEVAAYIFDNADDDQFAALDEASQSPQFIDEVMAELVKRTTNAGWAMAWLRAACTKLNELLAENRSDPDSSADANGSGSGEAGTRGDSPAHR